MYARKREREFSCRAKLVQAGGGCQHGSYECWSGRTPKALTETNAGSEHRSQDAAGAHQVLPHGN